MSFTDATLRVFSNFSLTAQTEVDAANAAKVGQVTGQADALSKDQAQETLFDNYRLIVEAYHAELAAINGSQRTNYNTLEVDKAAKRTGGNLHFPYPAWGLNFPPKKDPSNEGLPITALVNYEVETITRLNAMITQIKTGFADGAATTTTTAAYTAGTGTIALTSAAGFAVGNRIVFDNGGASAYGVITIIAGLNVTFVIIADANVGMGATVRNFHPGFPSNQRDGTVANTQPQYMTALRNSITTLASATFGFQDTQYNSLLNNNDTNQAAQIATATANAQAAILSITNWLLNGVLGFGDTFLNPFQTDMLSRQTFATSRVTEIITALGSITQDAEGHYTGTGVYHQMFQWLDYRINLASGSLVLYYGFTLGIAFCDEQVAQANAKKAEYDAMLLTKLITAITGDTVALSDTTGLAVSDSVQIIDDGATPSTTATILAITGLNVQLSTPIVGYTTAALARLVKLL